MKKLCPDATSGLRSLLGLVGACGLLGCRDTPAEPLPPPKLSWSAAELRLAVGASLPLSLRLEREGREYHWGTAPHDWPSDVTLEFSVADTGVATISADGVVQGKARGTTHVWAYAAGVLAFVDVFVDSPLETGFAAIEAGGSHTCGLRYTGRAYCWGTNWLGERGTGPPTPSPGHHVTRPTPVSGDLRFTELEATMGLTCGIVGPGIPYCWGDNRGGSVGDGSLVNRGTPTRVHTDVRLRLIRAGSPAVCGLTADGQTHCWGMAPGASATTPQTMGFAFRFRDLAVGSQHACGLTSEGKLFCWGANSSGQRGDGGNAPTVTPVAVEPDSSFRTVSAGFSHTCAVTVGWVAMCWGYNGDGQVGNGTKGTSVRQPATVSGGHSFTQSSLASTFSCAVAASGDAYCWGSNWRGQLGNDQDFNAPGTTADKLQWPTPQLVAGGHAFRSISTGFEHTCGITTAGVALCWGLNLSGQLGTGNTDFYPGTQLSMRTVPTLVLEP